LYNRNKNKMKLTRPNFKILSNIDDGMLMNIESYGRTCYKSESRITGESYKAFISMLISKGHESVLEHEKITVRFICDRGVSHEIVRHRLASFSQESTRYCNYKGGVEFILPPWVSLSPGEYPVTWDKLFGNSEILDTLLTHGSPESVWAWNMAIAERDYCKLLDGGWSPQQARSVLPNSLKTEIVVTANLREWRTILKQRTASGAHPQMRELMVPLLASLKRNLPVIFDDINP
jgi:thymidylate synthase (FAD)